MAGTLYRGGAPVAGADLVPLAAGAPFFTAHPRTVRFSECSLQGHLRFDAYARYTEDVSADDFYGRPAVAPVTWVVRRAVIEVHQAAVLHEVVDTTLWCSALSPRWCERRFTTVGSTGARYEMASLWVALDTETFRPVPIPEQLLDDYSAAAAGRSVSSKLVHPRPSATAVERPWQLRYADYDVLAHVHNTVYWQVLADEIVRRPEFGGEVRAEVEYHSPIGMEAEVHLLVADDDASISVWMMAGDRVHTSMRLELL